MHAERLNTLSGKILQTYDGHDIAGLLQQLIDAVAQRISSPTDPAFDVRLGEARRNLFTAVGQLNIDALPPIARKTMQELGLEVLFPDELRKRVDGVFQDRFVDSESVNSLKGTRAAVVDALTHLRQLRDGFVAMGIAEDALAPDEIEFDAAMPRDAIDDSLAGFSKVLASLNTELQVLASIAKDGREPLKINSIATNDFTVALNINVDLGDIIQAVLLGLIYVRLGSRKALDALKAPGLENLPAEIMDRTVTWARGLVDAEIEKLVDRLPADCPDSVDAAKLIQHRGQVIEAVKYLHDKEEVGFNMEVRTGDVPEDATEASEPDVAKREQINSRHAKIRAISTKAATLKVLTKQSLPILTLTEKKDGGDPPKNA